MIDDLPLRTQLWLIAHDDEDQFRLRVHPASLGIGLVGATLTDLVIDDRLRVDRDRVAPQWSNRTLVGDPVADAALTAIWAQARPTRIRDLLGELAPQMYRRSAAALLAAGMVAETRRGLRRVRYQPTDPNIVNWVRGGIRAAIGRAHAQQPPPRRDPPIDIDRRERRQDGLCALLRVLRLHEALYLASYQEADWYLTLVLERLRVGDARQQTAHTLARAVDAAVGDHTVAAYR